MLMVSTSLAGIDVVLVHVTVCPAAVQLNPPPPEPAETKVKRLSRTSVTTVFVPAGVAVVPVFVTVTTAVEAPPAAGSVLGLNDLLIVADGCGLVPTGKVALPVTAGTDLLSNEAVFVAVAVAVTGTVMVTTSPGAIAAALVHVTVCPAVVHGLMKPSFAVAVPGV